MVKQQISAVYRRDISVSRVIYCGKRQFYDSSSYFMENFVEKRMLPFTL